MNQCARAGWVVVAFLCVRCFAADPMEERAAQLAMALNISTNTTEHISCTPVFAGKETVKAGEFQVKKKRVMEVLSYKPIMIDILDAHGQAIAAGRIIECASFEMARQALLECLVFNSMGIENVAQRLEVEHGDVGDLCIIEKIFDKVSRKYISDPVMIQFVRGSTAVSLYPVTKSKDIHDIAKALDSVLSGYVQSSLR